MRRITARLAAFAAVAALAAAGSLLAVASFRAGREPSRAPHPAAAVRVVQAERQIEIPARVAASGFDHGFFMAGYHALVWQGGRAAGEALFRAEVSDTAALDALEALGAKPGDRLGMASWDERRNPRNPEPDRQIEGPPVEVLVRLPGRPDLPLAAFLEDPGGRGLELRFGGHRANIPRWHSGCIVCLYSCPGSKIGNARYTVRDYVRATTRFRSRRDLLPPDGTPVTLIVRLAPLPH